MGLIRAGRLTENIQIYKPVVSKDSYGSSSTEWEEVRQTKAQVDYSNGYRSVENSELVHGYTVNMKIRIYHQIEDNYRIKWSNRWWQVTSITPDKEFGTQNLILEQVNE